MRLRAGLVFRRPAADADGAAFSKMSSRRTPVKKTISQGWSGRRAGRLAVLRNLNAIS